MLTCRPSFIRVNNTILHNNQLVKVQDFEPKQAEIGYAIQPDCRVKIGGQWHDFDPQAMQSAPLSDDTPPFLRPGNLVSIFGTGFEAREKVQQVYMVDLKGGKPQIYYDGETLISIPYSNERRSCVKTRPVRYSP